MNVLDYKKLTRTQMLKLLAVILLSDGYVRPQNGRLYIETLKDGSEELHSIFSLLCKSLFRKNPRKTTRKRSSYCKIVKEYLISEIYIGSSVNELLKLSPTYKTSPGGTPADSFLLSCQPDVSFLLNENDNMKWLAVRMWFDFDGCIVPSFKMKNKNDKKKGRVYKYYQVQFECDLNIAETNPSLVKGLVELFKTLGLKASIKLDKRKWSGIDGIRISRVKDVREFVSLGPLTGIKISNKSPRFSGKTKRSVCNAVKEMLDNNESLSQSFKSREEAMIFQAILNKRLHNKIVNSPVV